MTMPSQAASRAPWRGDDARGAHDAQVARADRRSWLVSILLHAGLILVVGAWTIFAPKPPPTTAVFELVAMEQPKLRPLAPKAPEPPAEAPPESRPPPAPAPSLKPKAAASKPEPKHTRPAPPDPNLPVRDAPAENQVLNAVKSNVPSDPRLALWARHVQRQVEQWWNPPSGIEVANGTKVVVTFVASREGGKPGSVEIVKGSGNPMLDDLARRAVMRLENLPPIPENFPEDRLKVNYEFIYGGN